MSTHKDPLHLVLLISLLTSSNNRLKIKKIQNPNVEKLCSEFKLKCIYSKKISNEKNISNYKEVIPLLKDNTSIISTLKMIHLINYKEKFDQYQLKRTTINNFTYLSLRGKNGKKQIAYKNTENINTLYQLHQINHYSDLKNYL